MSNTYCKRGYFRWGKISQKCWQGLLCGGNFQDYTPNSLIKSYGFYFREGEIFMMKATSQKRENYPHAKISTFTVYEYCDSFSRGHLFAVL